MGLHSERPRLALVDLPVFPRGTLSPSLATVAGCLAPYAECRLFDQNFVSLGQLRAALDDWEPAAVGFKVSAQSLSFAQEWVPWAREQLGATVVWGGELPTLLPDECARYADTIVQGRLEDVRETFGEDLRRGLLQKRYQGERAGDFVIPAYGSLDLSLYHRFMGRPLETSRGCPYHCNFCMVHSMQPAMSFKSEDMLREELRLLGETFINVIDYNLGQDREHLLKTASVLEDSNALGWMGEMCLENLDDDEVLEALARSRCRMVYCGLDAVDRPALKFVGKTQNKTEDYARIIRRAQAKGVEVASGFILGVEHTDAGTFDRAIGFFEDVGIAYVKLTFLTYNPGTAVQAGMKRHGSYRTSAIDEFDGHHLTYVPKGVDPEKMAAGLRHMAQRLYSWDSLWRRTQHLAEQPRRRMEIVLFARCYAETYRHWLSQDLLGIGGGLRESFSGVHVPSAALQAADDLLDQIRRGKELPDVGEVTAAFEGVW